MEGGVNGGDREEGVWSQTWSETFTIRLPSGLQTTFPATGHDGSNGRGGMEGEGFGIRWEGYDVHAKLTFHKKSGDCGLT